MERVLLGYDGTAGADAALDWVTDRALRREARVEVVIVTNPLLQDRPMAEDQLARAERRLHTQIPALPVETARIDGRMPGALVDAAADADILVIGADPDRPAREALHGWMSLRVSSRSSVPTCVVPAGWSALSGPVTLALAADTSSDAASDYAASEAHASGESLRVVHAWSAPITSSGSSATAVPRREALGQHQELLTRCIEGIRQHFPGLAVEPVLVADNAVAALSRAVADSSLLVMGTHGKGVLAGGFSGSVGQDLIGSIRTPVVVVPSSG